MSNALGERPLSICLRHKFNLVALIVGHADRVEGIHGELPSSAGSFGVRGSGSRSATLAVALQEFAEMRLEGNKGRVLVEVGHSPLLPLARYLLSEGLDRAICVAHKPRMGPLVRTGRDVELLGRSGSNQGRV